MEFNEKCFMDTKIMKMLFVFLLIPLFVGCHQKLESCQDTALYKKYKEEAYHSIYNYNTRHFFLSSPEEQDVEGKKILDTALCVINKALVDFPNSPYFVEQKIYVLTERKDYDEAIRIASESEWTISEDSLYPHKDLVLNRLKFMKYLYLDDEAAATKYIQMNLQLIQCYLKKYEKEVDKHIKSKEDSVALKGTYFLVVTLYYRYYAIIYGKEEACKQLNKIMGINNTLFIFIESAILDADNLKYVMG